MEEKKKGSKIKVIIKEPGKPLRTEEIDNKLKAFQELVGGPIEALHISWDPEILLICNEDGKLEGLYPSFLIQGDMICGTAIFCGATEEDFADIPVEARDLIAAVPDLLWDEG